MLLSFFPGFIFIAQAPIKLVAGYLCVSQSNRNWFYGSILAFLWSVTCQELFTRLIKFNFKKNVCLVKEYSWGYYQDKAVRFPVPRFYALTNTHTKWVKKKIIGIQCFSPLDKYLDPLEILTISMDK